MPRSIWTHLERDDLVEIRVPPAHGTRWETAWVEPEHVDDVKRAIARAERMGSATLIALSIFLPALVLLTILGMGPKAGAFAGLGPHTGGFALSAFGLWMCLVAVPTPQTVDTMGLRKALIVVYVLGVSMVLVGGLIFFIAP